MLTERLVNNISTYGVPVYFFDEPKSDKDYCHAIIIPAEELSAIRGKQHVNEDNEPVGVHVLRCDSKELFEDFAERNLSALLDTAKLLEEMFSITNEQMNIAYTLFVVLHEIGHILHHQESGLSNSEYWYRYNGSRDDVWMIYQFCHNVICQSTRQQQLLQTFVNQIYNNIPSEKYANDFAVHNFSSNWQLISTGVSE